MSLVDYMVAVGAGALTGFVCAVPVGPINVAIIIPVSIAARIPNQRLLLK